MSVARRLSKISLEDNTVTKMITNMGTNALKALYVADNRNADVENMKPREFREYIGGAVHTSSVKYFVEQLSRDQLAAAVEPLNIDHKHNNPKSMKVLSKRLREYLLEHNIGSYLEEHATLEQLQGYAESLQIKVTSKDKKDYIAYIVEEAERNGMELFLQSFAEDVLRDIVFEMKLEKDPLATHAKSVLIECIMENKEAPEKEKKKKEKIVFSKSKKEIKSGITYQDIFQHYHVDELDEWCRDNGLKTTGTKKEIINRILAWLAGDKENTVAGSRKVAKRRKSTAPKKTSKSTTTKADKPAAVKPVEKPTKADKPAEKPVTKTPEPEEEPEEEEPEEEEPEEEVEQAAEEEGDELDLDNLESYDLETLKCYCEDEKIFVKGKNKKAYIQAILEYNEELEAKQ